MTCSEGPDRSGPTAPLRDRDRLVADLAAQLAEKELAYRELQEQLQELKAWRALWRSQRIVRRLARAVRLGRAVAVGSYRGGALLARLLLGLPARAARLLGLARHDEEPDEATGELRVGLQGSVPDELVVGKGTSLVLSGWAFHPSRCIRRLRVRVRTAGPRPGPGQLLDADETDDPILAPDAACRVVLGDRAGKVLARNLASPEALARYFPQEDPWGVSLNAGFLAEVVLARVAGPTRAQVVVVADLEDGRVATATLAGLTLLPERPAAGPIPIPPADPDSKVPLVVVCLATHEPPAELFARQIESLRRQTWPRWLCLVRDDASSAGTWEMVRAVIGDDPRFVLRRNSTNRDFYHNFEALLGDVPAEADLVALSDQDDVWGPDKLEQLARRFDPGVTLVYSDMRLTDPHGTVSAPTYWVSRDNNCTDAAALLLANTITGAAAMFRRSLLEYALPFPQQLPGSYHDHWLGLVALALGQVRFVPRPLYDYVQHGRQVIGHSCGQPRRSWRGRVAALLGAVNPLAARHALRLLLWPLRAGRAEHAQLLRIANLARNVLLRCGNGALPQAQSALREALHWRDAPFGWWRLVRRGLRAGASRLTCGVEWQLVRARLWAACQRLGGAVRHRLAVAGLLRHRAVRAHARTCPLRAHAGLSQALTERTKPLSLVVRSDPPSLARVNILLSVVDFKYLFGGYLTLFHLSRLLAERGWRVRLVLLDCCDYRPSEWAHRFQSYRGLERFLDQVELVSASDRQTPVLTSPEDVFLATNWWSAHVAHAAVRLLGRDRFVYLIQEHEPGFYPLGSEGAFAAESYTFPHYALFSSELLRQFFREQKIGVFAGPEGERDSLSFQNAITTIGEVCPLEVARRRQRRLLFYCRPEQHAARNLFEVGFLALQKAIREGAFRGWEIDGVGSVDVFGKLELAPGTHLTLLPRLTPDEYRKVLPRYDVGLALMATPHPSLVPLEMAAAGLCTVTTVHANKTADKLRALSPNLIPVVPTVSAVCAGLRQAQRQAHDFAARASGASVRWATTWEQAFAEPVLARLEQFLRAARTNTLPVALEPPLAA